MDTVIALVGLRFKLELRALRAARERQVGLVLAAPVLLIFSGVGALVAFGGVRSVAGADPEALLPLLSALATGIGVFWLVSPLLTGFALAETHDVSRLVHFPIPVGLLAVSSLIANLVQPVVLAEIPIALAIAAGLAGSAGGFLLASVGALATLAFYLAASQTSGLLLHALTRNRRLHDAALFVALGFGFVMSLLPVLVLTGNLGPLARLLRAAVRSDLFLFSPFAWGARAAVNGGRGDAGAFAGWIALQAVAIAAALFASAALIQRIHSGELKLGRVSGRAGGAPARMRLPGAVGALLEKDLRVAWRDPALKATLLMGLLGPLVFFFLVARTGAFGNRGSGLLMLATYVGISTFGSNAFGMERRGIGLLLSFPLARWRVLVGKNLSGMVFRMPALLALALAGAALAPPFLPAALTIALCAMLIAAGADNYVSILFPITAPAPGRSPYAGNAAGGRGLGTAFLSALLFAGALFLASPFILLAWLPVGLGRLSWWWGSLPLALLGAAASYALLVGGAEQLLLRREPELVERILGEA